LAYYSWWGKIEIPMKKIALILFVVSQLCYASSSASDSPEPSVAQNKKPTYTVNCSGLGKKWDDCYQEAENLCPDGYKILKKSSGVIAAPVNGQTTLAPSKKLVIQCK